MTDPVETLLEERRRALVGALGRPLPPPVAPTGPGPSAEERRFLQEEGEAFYWNELEWENLTEEERVDGEPLAELAFTGFLAYVRGLLLEEVMPDSLAPAEPRPEVVEALLSFLAGRVLELREEGEPSGESPELALTRRLLDLVLGLLHRVSAQEMEGSGSGA